MLGLTCSSNIDVDIGNKVLDGVDNLFENKGFVQLGFKHFSVLEILVYYFNLLCLPVYLTKRII